MNAQKTKARMPMARKAAMEFLVVLSRQADLAGAERLPSVRERRRFVFESLRAIAEEAQAPIQAALSSRGVEHRAFWIVNMILVRGGIALARELAGRGDVAQLAANPVVRLSEPTRPVGASRTPAGALAAQTIEWNVTKIHAPDLWALGIRGEGVVVAGEDTGYAWEHPVLKAAYRGWNGTSADHDYNWHDAIHSGGGSCGFDSPFPCDDFGHGTHTMGTAVGDDGSANQIGVAPGARWIGCRNMDQGNGTPARYAECFQFFLAPTNLAGGNPDPSKAPDVVNNSWTCPPSEGCTDPNVLKTVVENVRAAGIVVVAGAGNAGPACSTVSDPPAIYAAALTVGATDSTDTVANFSSRGPVTADGSSRMKPNLTAPGVSVRSSIPATGYSALSGTSMAGPHVVGAVALLQSAFPALNGDQARIETLFERSATPLTSVQTCGGVPGSQVPNILSFC
jgi:subtilisin family serine protease